MDYRFRGQRLRYRAGSSKRAAEHLRLRIESEINAGKHAPDAVRREVRGERTGGLTFGALVEQFRHSYRSRGRTGYYEEKARGWLRHFPAAMPVAEIGPLEVEQYRNMRSEQVGHSTVRKDLISLGTLFRWAMRMGLVSENPADPVRVKRPTEPAADSRALTQEEQARLIAVCPIWLAAVIGWACHTGMDKGTVLGLRWSGLDLRREGKRIVSGSVNFLRSKTGKPVRQVLSASALAALNQARQARHASGVVFLAATSQPIEEKALDWALGKAFKAAEVRGANFRTFRHSFATWALRSGVHPTVLAKMMGHSTTFILDRYLFVGDDLLEKAAEMMSGNQVATTVRPTEPEIQ